MLHKIKTSKHVKSYIKAVKPPYTKHDIPYIAGTFAVFLVLYIIFLLTNNNIILRDIFASNHTTIPPTKPQILIGTEHPVHIPFTHAEQGTVYLYWLASTDSIGISGYKIYRNDTFIGQTTSTSFVDTGVSGSITYAIEAYDPAGNTARSTLHINLPKTWTADVSQSDSVVSGFVLNKITDNPIGNTIITVAGGKTIHTDQNGYFYYIFPNGNDGSVQLTLDAKGYNSDTENVTLKKGQSVNQTIYLVPQTSGRSGIGDTVVSFLKKLF